MQLHAVCVGNKQKGHGRAWNSCWKKRRHLRREDRVGIVGRRMADERGAVRKAAVNFVAEVVVCRREVNTSVMLSAGACVTRRRVREGAWRANRRLRRTVRLVVELRR